MIVCILALLMPDIPTHKRDVVITEDLGEAIKTSNSPFKACEPYVQFFDKYGQENGGWDQSLWNDPAYYN